MALVHYIKSTRFPLAIYFLEVILGAFYISNFNIFNIDLIYLFFIFISFQPLYYAIYVINDIIDYPSDRINPKRQHRPIASGKITIKNALIFSIILILFSFLIAINLSYILFLFELFFLIYNLIYSFLLKKIPYIDTLAGGVTHTARFVMGISLFGFFREYGLAFAILIFVTTCLLIRRMNEIKNYKGVRHPMKYYSYKKIVIFWIVLGFIIFILFLLSSNLEKAAISIIFLLYLIIIFGYNYINYIKELFDFIANY